MEKRIYRFISIITFLAALVMIVALFAGCGDQQNPVGQPALAPGAQSGGNGDFEPGEVLVKFKHGASSEKVKSLIARHNAVVEDKISGIDVDVLQIGVGQELEKAKAFREEPLVEYAEPNYVAYALEIPNDPYFWNQWGLTWTQTSDAWNTTHGNSGINISILDTGVDQSHQDLMSKITTNQNFTRSKTADDRYGHGTHVAGIAAAVTNNGLGIAGIGWGCSLMNVKVLGDKGSGKYSWIANGIIWAADNGAKVINMSFGGSRSSDTLKSAVDYAWNKGCVLTAAAGNNSDSTPLYPACYDNCIAVAASDRSDNRASFSNYGDWVDVAAPGVDIFSTLPDHKNRTDQDYYGYMSGTSMAASHVAGMAGLVWATPYGISNTAVRDRIEKHCDPLTGGGVVHGRINVLKAVDPLTP